MSRAAQNACDVLNMLDTRARSGVTISSALICTALSIWLHCCQELFYETIPSADNKQNEEYPQKLEAEEISEKTSDRGSQSNVADALAVFDARGRKKYDFFLHNKNRANSEQLLGNHCRELCFEKWYFFSLLMAGLICDAHGLKFLLPPLLSVCLHMLICNAGNFLNQASLLL